MASKKLDYRVIDPTIEALHASKKPVRYLRAARGTGKTTAALLDLFGQSISMPPSSDGVRYSRFLITRTSYRDLEQSAIKSYKERLEGCSGIRNISNKEPWYGGVSMKLPDGTRVESEWVFQAVAPDDYGKLGSQQFTGGYINELSDYTDSQIVNAVMSSCGRYPSKDSFSKSYIEKCEKEGKPLYFKSVVCDTNGPFESHWLRGVEDAPPDTWDVYVQAAPLFRTQEKSDKEHLIHHNGWYYYPNKSAKYVTYLQEGYKYWADMIGGAEDWMIESRVLGQFSKSVAGKRVYPEFREEMIMKKSVNLDDFQGYTLTIGIDTSGMHPAATFAFYKDATWYIVDEIGAQDTTYVQFVQNYIVPMLSQKYSGFSHNAFLDPANPRYGGYIDNASTNGQVAAPTALAATIQAGIRAKLCGTNKFQARAQAVRNVLSSVDRFFISPDCKILIEGFRGKYHYKELGGAKGVFELEPNKRVIHADYHDSLQYAIMGSAGAQTAAYSIKQTARRKRYI